MYFKNYTQQHLFIMDNYNSYIIVNFIAVCMEYLIDLFILFLHILHLFQLFDLSIFVPLKCALIEKINAIF